MNKKAVLLGALLLAAGGAVLAWRKSQAAGEGGSTWLPSFDLTLPDYFPDVPDTTDYFSQVADAIEQNYQDIESNLMPASFPNKTQSLSNTGLSKIKVFEGFSATPYPDHKGNSIGYGHLIKAGENLTYVTRAQAETILLKDAEWAQNAVRNSIKVTLAQGQFDALVSFCYNVGEGAFRSSMLVKRINAGDSGAPAEFDRWIYASGQVNQTLVARRQDERADFESAYA
ncbi:hypothetical protein BH10PSE16_BH10PSE16_43760 [soil metagenome]